MTLTITAFERSPDGGMGLARDTRVRRGLEEVGQPYEVRGVSFTAMKEPAHLALNPFGRSDLRRRRSRSVRDRLDRAPHRRRPCGLLPDDANARARAITWMFAAVNTVEPPILERETATLLERDKPWPSSACLSSRIVSATGWANFPLASAMPTGSMARSARAT